MSRVFSRRPGFRFLFGVSDSSAVADRVLEEREMSQLRLALATRKKALDQCMIQVRLAKRQPPAAHRSRRDARQSYRPRRCKIWAPVPLQAKSQLRLPVSAFLAALFLQTWPVECLELPCSGHASLCRRLRA